MQKSNLENNPKQTCLYIAIETQNREHELLASKENFHFDDQSKQVDFLFCVAVFSKRNRKHVLPVSTEL